MLDLGKCLDGFVFMMWIDSDLMITDGLENFIWLVPDKVNRLQARIGKVIPALLGCYRVLNGTLSMLEPCAVKVARRVLRGLGSGNTLRLPDTARKFAALPETVGAAADLER